MDRKPARAEVREFRFEADAGGEFWFATRTIDGAGNAHPAGPIKPQLKVFVDTQQPRFEWTVDADASGRVDVVVNTDDATPVTTLLRYVTDVNSEWRSVETEPLGEQGSGTLSFTPDEAWQQLSIQLVMTDSAKNRQAQSQLIHRPRMAGSPLRFASNRSLTPGHPTRANAAHHQPPGERSAMPSNPIIKLDRQPAPPPSQVVTPNQVITPGFGSRPGVVSTPGFRHPKPRLAARDGFATSTSQARPPAPHPSRLFEAPTEAQQIAANRPFGPPSLFRSAPLAGNAPRTTFAQTPSSATPNRAPANGTTDEPLPPPASADEISHGFKLTAPEQANSDDASAAKSKRPRTAAEALRPIDEPSATHKKPAIETIPTPKPEHDKLPSKAPRQAAARPPSEIVSLEQRAPLRFSNSVRFSLDYEVEAIGNGGVDAIELYGSLDQGKTWRLWGADPDQMSPFDIETKEQGLFGFRIAVTGRNGLASPRPLPGDAPDLFVLVDTFAPFTRITGAQYGEGDRVGALVIRYECKDDHLKPRPVALAFSETTEGPWTTIAAGLSNQGTYIWPADPGLPRQIYLRIDVTDKAGNVGTHILDRPVDTQGLAPRARIRGFKPLSQVGSPLSELDFPPTGKTASRDQPFK